MRELLTESRDAPAGALTRPLQEINERCITLLMAAARAPRAGVSPLAAQLSDVFRATTPEGRARAARTAFLLVDLEFTNELWWKTLQGPRGREIAQPAWRGSFPRAGAMQLARATVTLAWHALRTHEHARCLLGMTPAVAEIVATLTLADIDRIAERRHVYLRPRWEDRPKVWRDLLRSAETPDLRRTREMSLRGLQLLAGDLL